MNDDKPKAEKSILDKAEVQALLAMVRYEAFLKAGFTPEQALFLVKP